MILDGAEWDKPAYRTDGVKDGTISVHLSRPQIMVDDLRDQPEDDDQGSEYHHAGEYPEPGAVLALLHLRIPPEYHHNENDPEKERVSPGFLPGNGSRELSPAGLVGPDGRHDDEQHYHDEAEDQKESSPETMWRWYLTLSSSLTLR